MSIQEWTIRAIVNGKTVGWTYNDLTDAKRAWGHMRRKKTTIDTNDPISHAWVRMSNGNIYYLDEATSWR